MASFIQDRIQEEDVGSRLQAALDHSVYCVINFLDDEHDESNEIADPLVIAHLQDVHLSDDEAVIALLTENLDPSEDTRFSAALMNFIIPGERREYEFHSDAKFFRSVMIRAGRAAFKHSVLELRSAKIAAYRGNQGLSDNELENAAFEQGRAS